MESTVKTPVALTTVPIVEATFELRFAGKQKQLGDLLPGMLFGEFNAEFPALNRLPASEFPRALTSTEPAFAYQPLQSMDGDGKRILIGDRTVALSFMEPYPGWREFRAVIVRLISALNSTGLVESVERFSLRYLNILEGGHPFDLKPLKLKIDLAGLPLRGPGLKMQAEIERNGCIAVVQLNTGATVTLNKPSGPISHRGLMLAVDTVMQQNLSNFLSGSFELLDLVHQTEKEVFFSLLTPETLQFLGPKWEGE